MRQPNIFRGSHAQPAPSRDGPTTATARPRQIYADFERHSQQNIASALGGICRRCLARNTVFVRFRYWIKACGFKRMFEAVFGDPDMGYAMVDATIVRVHRHGQGAKRGTQNQTIGKSKGGLTTKILALTDALGNLVRFVPLPGQRYETVGVASLLDGIELDDLIDDEAFDSNAIIADLTERGAKDRGLPTSQTDQADPNRPGD